MTTPALAKGEVEATLKTRIPPNAFPGEQLTIAWKLVAADEDGKRRPFGAGGVFIKLLSASGGRATVAFAEGDGGRTGNFRASVIVPEGGIGGILIGLRGLASGPAGSRTSDLYFPVKNNPLPAAAPAEREVSGEAPPSRSREAESNSSASAWLGVLAITLSLALAGLAVDLWQRRRRNRDLSMRHLRV